MSTVRQPLHEHTCLMCRGKYSCWDVHCAQSDDIVCDDCGEIEEENKESARASRNVC